MIQEVCFVDVDVWGAQAESCRQFLQKGRPVLIEGRLKLDTWDDQNGQKRSKHSIVADRVVFLSQAQQADASTEADGADAGLPGLNPNNPAEKELMNQIAGIKSRTQARTTQSAPAPRPMTAAPQFDPAKAPAAVPKKRVVPSNPMPAATTSGEVAFTDEPPFQDDLPF
jgi:single-strand DNA-binding protein